MNHVRTLMRYIDVVSGAVGTVLVVAGVALLFGWVIAMLVAGVALLIFSMVVPEWD